MVSALHSEAHIQQTLNAFESAREVAAFAVDALDALGGCSSPRGSGRRPRATRDRGHVSPTAGGSSAPHMQ